MPPTRCDASYSDRFEMGIYCLPLWYRENITEKFLINVINWDNKNKTLISFIMRTR